MVLAFFSILVAGTLEVAWHIGDLQAVWWTRLVSVPSSGAVFLLLTVVTDRHAWRWRVLRALHIIEVPDLSGTWTGTVRSSYDGGSDTPLEHDVQVTIRQSWLRMVITLRTSSSRSRSYMAALLPDDATAAELTYTYLNEPDSNTPMEIETHKGTAELHLSDGQLRGRYFTGRGRRQIGDIDLTRAP